MRPADVLIAAWRLRRFERHMVLLAPVDWIQRRLQRGHGEIVRQAAIVVPQHDTHPFARLQRDRRIRRGRIPEKVERHPACHQRDLPILRTRDCRTRQRAGDHDQHPDGDQLRRYPITPDTHPTNIPVTYMTANPASSPLITGVVANARRIVNSRPICLAIWPITWAMAPTPIARNNT